MPQPMEQELELAVEKKRSSKIGLNSGSPKTIPAGEFKAKCLKLMDEVAETREPLIITKFGKPVAKLIPIPPEKFDIIGAMRGSVLWEGDIISPIDVEWDAMQ